MQSYSFSWHSKGANISFPDWSFYLVVIVRILQKSIRYLIELQIVLQLLLHFKTVAYVFCYFKQILTRKILPSFVNP